MRLLAALFLLGAAPAARAYEWTPLGEVVALGGLHSFEGGHGSFTGNVQAAFAPAVRVSERWALLPTARAEYEGTRPLSDALGTATPNQQRAEGRFGLRGVYGDASSRWRFKPRLVYDAEFLKETKDEDWGKGLFDQRRLVIGGEVELLMEEPRALRFGIDWFTAAYPNYTTLESQAALQFQGQSLSRELVGDRALDREGYQFAASGEFPIGARAAGAVKASVVWSKFGRQPVVDEGGQLRRDTREDFLADASFTARMPHEWNADLRALGAFELGLAANSSNQNGYDATRGRFMPGFYDFTEWRVGPSVSVVIGPVRRPVTATFRLGWKRRDYAHRQAQTETGAYSSEALHTTEWSGGLGLTYPMSPRLSLVFKLDRVSASSNQGFSPYYRYAYQATSALAGVRWEW